MWGRCHLGHCRCSCLGNPLVFRRFDWSFGTINIDIEVVTNIMEGRNRGKRIRFFLPADNVVIGMGIYISIRFRSLFAGRQCGHCDGLGGTMRRPSLILFGGLVDLNHRWQ